MAKIKLAGGIIISPYIVTAKGRESDYAYRGGPRLPGERGSQEYVDAYRPHETTDFCLRKP